ncbi:MAG TPA: hypothetical protein VIK50_11045 [Gemmatimonadaceae bacterium]
MVTSRRGRSRLGCLVGLLFLVTVVYFGFNIGEVYFRFYRLKDAMAQEARFAQTRDDNMIRTHLAAVADSLGLPDEAGRVTIRRDATRIVISSDYSEHVELPLFVREFRFAPQVVRSF